MKKVTIGLVGFGNVGAGVIKILRDRKRFLSDKTGTEVVIKKICDKDITSKRNVPVDKALLTNNINEILDDPQIDILVELMGGVHPAKEFITQALLKGKHVVTANKALLAECGKELFALASDRDKSIYFEASVGAGIPILKSLREGLVANKFLDIFGIVNGTSNYVLSQMAKDGCDFSVAVKDAQKKGFAEKDPTLDIEGIDSAHKLVILTYLGFGKLVEMKDLYIEGISRVTLQDVGYAKDLGFEIKLLAIAKNVSGELDLRVHPTLVPKGHMLASVNGVFNAIYVSSDLAGDLMFYGPGAGQLAAASAVVSDIIDLAQNMKAGMFRPKLNIVEDTAIHKLRKIDERLGRYYVRLIVLDEPGVLAKIASVLAKFGISIASVTQKERIARMGSVPIVMISHEAREKDLRLALDAINKLNAVTQKAVAIRIEEL
ncbi:MAG TPA: homoserine dehydrogenase [Candidatus Omnitrophota bacterium]|mgnify:CR=1 FL=1|nr:homoserine dehydrogenase [Candidatus Omnitrophota bacterium]HPT07737.1 homoserine dehydrogenase [Candidatus Omnitrophota bacterium]